MYNHVSEFTSGILFTDQGILDFAHELLGTVAPEPEDEDPRASYKHVPIYEQMPLPENSCPLVG